MKLASAAIHFDLEQAYDGYTGAALYKCQFSTFDDAAGDGSTNRRRGMSVGPAVNALVNRRCIRLLDQRWLVGEPTDDGFQGVAMRKNHNLKRATDLLWVRTPAQALAASDGLQVYAQKHYFKDTVNALTDNEYDPFWNVFFSPTETVVQGAVLLDASGVYHRVRQQYLVPEGFRIAQTDQFDSDAYVSVVVGIGAYNRITDTYAAGTSTVNVLQMDASKFYRWRQQSESRVLPGDRTVFFAVNYAVGKQFTMQGLLWQIVMIQPELDAYAALVRLA